MATTDEDSTENQSFYTTTLQEVTATVISKLPFYLPEHMVNHKKMVHPPCNL